MTEHWAVFIDNNSEKAAFIQAILKSNHSIFKPFISKKGMLFSPIALEHFIEEEERHDHKLISKPNQYLRTMSSGEQKKALLSHILRSKPAYVILDNPFDNLDTDFQEELKHALLEQSKHIAFIQLVSRKSDVLPFITNFGKLQGAKFSILKDYETNERDNQNTTFKGEIPPPLVPITFTGTNLIQFNDVSIFYREKPILTQINWKVDSGEFWQLMGKNGSGKTTILSMVIGDNPKAFGQDIYLFGKKKGTGESVWDIKQKLGYFSPAMTDKFTGRHSIEHMLISGLTDSIGLYTIPTAAQKRIVGQWLALLDLTDKKDLLFRDLSTGLQRLIMTSRAMVKHPPLLILDEPTTGMDDASAKLLVALVNKISSETNTAIVFVSHRSEPGLLPKKVLQLKMTEKGSVGIIKS